MKYVFQSSILALILVSCQRSDISCADVLANNNAATHGFCEVIGYFEGDLDEEITFIRSSDDVLYGIDADERLKIGKTYRINGRYFKNGSFINISEIIHIEEL